MACVPYAMNNHMSMKFTMLMPCVPSVTSVIRNIIGLALIVPEVFGLDLIKVTNPGIMLSQMNWISGGVENEENVKVGKERVEKPQTEDMVGI